MQHSTLQKGRMPAALVDYLLQIPPKSPLRRQVHVSADYTSHPSAFSVGKISKSGPELQLAMLLQVKTPQGHINTLRALIDTGAEANLIRRGFLAPLFLPADDPIQLVAANGQQL